MKNKDKKTKKRKQRVRLKIKSVTSLPRLSVFRSNRYIYAQIIDKTGRVLSAANSLGLKNKLDKSEQAAKVGQEVAQKAQTAKIRQVVFDRGAYRYHGRVKALVEGARKAGLKF